MTQPGDGTHGAAPASGCALLRVRTKVRVRTCANRGADTPTPYRDRFCHNDLNDQGTSHERRQAASRRRDRRRVRGLEAVRKLRRAHVEITLIDRRTAPPRGRGRTRSRPACCRPVKWQARRCRAAYVRAHPADASAAIVRSGHQQQRRRAGRRAAPRSRRRASGRARSTRSVLVGDDQWSPYAPSMKTLEPSASGAPELRRRGDAIERRGRVALDVSGGPGVDARRTRPETRRLTHTGSTSRESGSRSRCSRDRVIASKFPESLSDEGAPVAGPAGARR